MSNQSQTTTTVSTFAGPRFWVEPFCCGTFEEYLAHFLVERSSIKDDFVVEILGSLPSLVGGGVWYGITSLGELGCKDTSDMDFYKCSDFLKSRGLGLGNVADAVPVLKFLPLQSVAGPICINMIDVGGKIICVNHFPYIERPPQIFTSLHTYCVVGPKCVKFRLDHKFFVTLPIAA